MDLAGRQALAQAAVIKSALDAGAGESRIRALLEAVRETGGRMTIVSRDGRVTRDSHVGDEALPGLDGHNDRPEIEAARAVLEAQP
jgi:sensor histidine kinase regulating citrate/malate metabolism